MESLEVRARPKPRSARSDGRASHLKSGDVNAAEKEAVDEHRSNNENANGDEDELESSASADPLVRGSVNDESVTINESDRRKMHQLEASLEDQRQIFKNEFEDLQLKRESEKERVKVLFSKLREALLRKENDLLNSIDAEYNISEDFLKGFIHTIDNEKHDLDIALHDADHADLSRTSDLIEGINDSLRMRDDILSSYQIRCFTLNEEVISTLENLSLGGFEELSTRPYSECADTQVTADEVELVAGSDSVHSSDRTEEYVGAVGFQESESAADQATSRVENIVTMPTAPPLESTESPPPYWQAVGLEGPEDSSRSTQPVIPRYSELHHSPNIRTENTLELWHTFPIRRENDMYKKAPVPVAMTWNYGRICIADKANMKVKFFSPDGHVLDTVSCAGMEIHDLCFLEHANGESRYLLAGGNVANLYQLLGVDSSDAAYTVQRFYFHNLYTSVSRGPRQQTLVGADFNPKISMNAEIHLFSFNMGILLKITHTPSGMKFSYPKAVEVFEQYIIVLDWKLNTVCVYRDNGMPVAEYRGTPAYPLGSPLDITLDPAGNIMILNGEFTNIHVIDLHCNFIEVIQIPRNVFSGSTDIKLIAFDVDTRKLALARSSGVAVFSFQNGYSCLPQRNLPPPPQLERPRQPAVLPLIEGMLPSTIENMIARQPARNRMRQFHL